MPSREDVVRFISFVCADQETGCWNWQGNLDRKGYAKFWWESQTGRGSRFSYLAFRDSSIEGLDIDHLCRNRRCVNPLHLEAVTRRENVLRGMGITAIHAKRQVCVRGHALTDDNVYRWEKAPNSRICKTCARERAVQRYKENPEKYRELKRQSDARKRNA